MVAALQIISKVLLTQDISIIENYQLTEEYFTGWEDEYNFIIDHYKKYGTVPDKVTFLDSFNDLDIVEVEESDQYLVDTIREENLYYKSVPVVQNIAKLLKTDANKAVEYMYEAIQELQPQYNVSYTDISKTVTDRYNQHLDRKNNKDKYFLTTGFKELDDIIYGLQRGEEFLVILARINEGKSWILEKITTHIWELGLNVGYVSPEMSADKIGYRFDTLKGHFSNKALTWGLDGINEEEFLQYANTTEKSTNRFIVTSPKDFDRRLTISKLRNFIKEFDLDFVAIDGITYLADERFKKGDNKTTSLTNISEDLMELSIEMGIPIAVVVQANRGGVVYGEDNDDTPGLEHIKDSDGIAANASKVLSVRQQKELETVTIGIKKNRDGYVGGKVSYKWNIDIGDFEYLEGGVNKKPKQEVEEKPKTKRKSEKPTDVF